MRGSNVPELLLINRARAFLGLTLEEAQRLLGSCAIPERGDEYGRMKDLTSLEDRQVFPGTLYLENQKVILVRVNRRGLAGLAWDGFSSLFSGAPLCLRSPAGKKANLFVYADEGLACSVQGGALDFLEVFIPCPQGEYETRIYKKPAPFIR